MIKIESIPYDVWRNIFSYISPNDIFHVFLVCTDFHKLQKCLDIWQYWIKSHFPVYYNKYSTCIAETNLKIQEQRKYMKI
jgi:hypothetical protein